jgi:hypothetical protein
MKKLLFALFLLCVSAHAQSRVDFGASLSTSRNLGYLNPDAGIAGHFVKGRGGTDTYSQANDSWRNRVGFEGTIQYLPRAHKVQTGNGRAETVSAVGRLYLANHGDPAPITRFFLSAGVAAAHQSTSLWSKTAAGPSFGVGYDDGETALQFTYDHLFGENKSNGLTLSGERLIGFNRPRFWPLRSRTFLSLRPFVTVVRFTVAQAVRTPRETGARAGIIIALGIRKDRK